MQWTPIGVALLFVHCVSALSLNVSDLSTTPMANVSLPDGVTNHSNPNLICTPASWFTVASFILGNYVAHAATTQVFTGETLPEQVLALMKSLLYPGAGVARGLNGIARGILVARHGNTELQKAAAAGALCMVIRTPETLEDPGVKHLGPWVYRPPWLQPTQFFRGWKLIDFPDLNQHSERSRNIHGILKELPEGYEYILVPPEAIITSVVSTEHPIHLANSFNTSKIIVAIFQAIYSSYTLYKSQGDQIQRFGYAAFSLTVAPYTIMSIINLVGGLLLPTYPALFLIQSEASVAIEASGEKYFDGTVGMLTTKQDGITRESTELHKTPFPKSNSFLLDVLLQQTWSLLRSFRENWIFTCLSFFFAVILPGAIMGGLSGWKPGGSTNEQRVLVPLWVFCGGFYGIAFTSLSFAVPRGRTTLGERIHKFMVISLVALYGTPAIAGLVVVGKMIKGYGDCERL